MADKTEKKSFWDSAFWQNLKGGQLASFGTEVTVADSTLLKVGGTVIIVVVVIFLVRAIINSLSK